MLCQGQMQKYTHLIWGLGKDSLVTKMIRIFCLKIFQWKFAKMFLIFFWTIIGKNWWQNHLLFTLQSELTGSLYESLLGNKVKIRYNIWVITK